MYNRIFRLTVFFLSRQEKNDDLIEFTETDCTSPQQDLVRKRAKPRSKQMTMYDYASSVSFRYKQFYSSLTNTTSTATVVKGQKRSAIVFIQ